MSRVGVSIRIPSELLERIDALKEKLASPGMIPRRSDVLLLVLKLGVETLERGPRRGKTQPKGNG
jgi:hypothetical protein